MVGEDRVTRAVVAVALVCIVLGAAARLARLDAHVVGVDEIATELHVAGRTERDALDAFAGERVVQASLAKQVVIPGNDRGMAAVVASLAAEDPQHPPLFYVLERAWVDHVGDAVGTRRALPALLGVLAIAAAGCLCALATRSSLGGWVGAGLFAVSPLQIVYSQQMREYSLFAMMTCIATAMVIVLARGPRVETAAGYALTAIAGLYTFTLFVLVLLAHVTIVAALRPKRGAWRAFALAIVAAGIAWIPWSIVLLRQHEVVASANDWSRQNWSLEALGAKTLFNVSTTFFDLHYGDLRWAPFAALVLGIVTLALIALRRANREAVAVVVAMIVWCYGAILAGDVVFGGHRSAVPRYVIPLFCALIVAVAAWVSAAVQRRSGYGWACAGALVLCSGGVLSIIGRAGSDVWWDDYQQRALRPLAAVIDGVHLPILVTDANWPLVVNLSNYCRTDPAFVLMDADEIPGTLQEGRTVLVLTSSEQSSATLRQDRRLEARSIFLSGAAPSPVMAFKQGFRTRAGAAREAEDDGEATLLSIRSVR